MVNKRFFSRSGKDREVGGGYQSDYDDFGRAFLYDGRERAKPSGRAEHIRVVTPKSTSPLRCCARTHSVRSNIRPPDADSALDRAIVL